MVIDNIKQLLKKPPDDLLDPSLYVNRELSSLKFNERVLEEVLKRACKALSPGGEFHLVGETLDDEKGGPLGPALWGIHEALFGSEGRAHSEAEVRGYLERAGFVEVEVHGFVPGSLTRITGKKVKR